MENSDIQKNIQENQIEIKAKVSVTSTQLYYFNLYHCYRNSSNGAFGIILGVLCLFYGIAFRAALGSSSAVIAVILGIIFLIYNPISLFIRSKSRYLSNDALKKPVDYVFDERGFILSQGEISEDMEWADLYKVVETKESLYFFFTKVHANIVPKECLGDDINVVFELLNKNLSKKANKLKKEHRS